MEEDKKQIIIPLSEYRKMEQKILDLTQKNKEKKKLFLKSMNLPGNRDILKLLGKIFM